MASVVPATKTLPRRSLSPGASKRAGGSPIPRRAASPEAVLTDLQVATKVDPPSPFRSPGDGPAATFPVAVSVSRSPNQADDNVNAPKQRNTTTVTLPSPRTAPAPASAPTRTRSVRPDSAKGKSRRSPLKKKYMTPSPAGHRRRLPAAAMSPNSSMALKLPEAVTPLYDSGHLDSPGLSAGLHSEESVREHPGSFSTLTRSFSSPTHVGIRRPVSAIIPRAKRSIQKPVQSSDMPLTSGELGGVGRRAALSRLKNPPSFRMASSTREREARRWKAHDETVHSHGPADYHVKHDAFMSSPPKAVIGSAPRNTDTRPPTAGPGPGACVPKSELRRNRSALFGTAPRKTLSTGAVSTPGPSAYAPERAKVGFAATRKAPAAHFGTSRRRGLVPDVSGPGVGSYNTRSGTFVSGNGRRAPSFGFSTARRF